MTPPRPPPSPPGGAAAPNPPVGVKSQREIELEALLEKALQGKEEAEREKEEAEREKEEAEREKEEAERKIRNLPLIDFLEGMEEAVFPVLLIERDPSKTAGTGPTKVAGKMYPSSIQPWTEFPALHEAAFDEFRDKLGDTACFTSSHGIEMNAEMLAKGMRSVANEDDIRPFINFAIEAPAATVTTEYLRVLHPEKQYEVIFRNNAYSMLAANSDGKRPSPDKDLQPDRWGFLSHDHDGEQNHEVILVAEYKAPHKLKLATLRRVMDTIRRDTFFRDAIQGLAEVPVVSEIDDQGNTVPTVRVPGHVLVAQILCQTYHYMVGSGCEFGYISAGNSLVLLKVDAEPPYTMHYHAAYFAVPSVVDAAVRRQQSHGLRQAHETAAAYLASLCQLAWRTTARSPLWIANAKQTLLRWPGPQGRLGGTTPTSGRSNDAEGPGGDPGGPGGTGGEGGSGGPPQAGGAGGGGPLPTAVRLPLPSRPSKRDRSPEPSQRHGDHEATAAFPEQTTTPTPSKKYVVEPPILPYCTQACLLGLVSGLPLDVNCPNVALHRAARIRHGGHAAGNADGHALTAASLRARLVDQIAANMDKDCQCLAKFGFWGRNAVLFKLTVTGFGYTFVGKSVLATMRPMLEREVKVYRAVVHLQGRLTPVCLGLIDLAEPIPLQNCQEVSHMLLLSYAGPDCATRNLHVPADVNLEQECWRTTLELQQAGIYNDDVRDPNVAWNSEVHRVMHFDFDRVDMNYLPKVAEAEEEKHVRGSNGLDAVHEDGDAAKTTQDDIPVKIEPTPATRSPLLDKRNWNGQQRGVVDDGDAKQPDVRDDNILAGNETTYGNEAQGPARKRVRKNSLEGQ